MQILYDSNVIIYSDHQYKDMLFTLIARLREGVTAARGPGITQVERLRSLLIRAGEVEQAAHDQLPKLLLAEEAQEQIIHLHAATSHIADAFCTARVSTPAASFQDNIESSLDSALNHFSESHYPEDILLIVRMPEGFAFYAIYPEQYCISAERWLHEHAQEQNKHIAVVGIRSIGTTLAAVVAATLRAGGWRVSDFTVRPTGRPYQRLVEITEAQIEGAAWGLVLDEGPGVSGSSIAAVAEALVRAGLPRERISFFPSHGGEPGGAASDEIRHWWATTSRYFTPIEEARFGRRDLQQAFVAWLDSLGEWQDPVESIKYIGRGEWRKVVYTDTSEWPAVCSHFERPKYLATRQSGQRILFKFEGICSAPTDNLTRAEAIYSVIHGRNKQQPKGEAQRRWSTHQVLGVFQGFVAYVWSDDFSPLAASNYDRLGIHTDVGHYISTAAGPELAVEQQRASIDRLAEILYCNTWQALGHQAAELTRVWIEVAYNSVASGTLAYGDGRMAPHKWLMDKRGYIKKVDGAGHTWDHTNIGLQAVAWDVAGFIIEWGLDDAQVMTLLRAYYHAGGRNILCDLLHFYLMAYAAFRAGLCHTCANMMTHEPMEQSRLQIAYATYRDHLVRLLDL
ncbi:MAG: hypothetical protein M3437_08415 [Chloroflexota bacterium]|nr:hypothetical protein [Chloroflexota bacterium]MDQ5867127.1 hypothetical protein [Chloroflexota bacterium]